jgi:hypothetical protein
MRKRGGNEWARSRWGDLGLGGGGKATRDAIRGSGDVWRFNGLTGPGPSILNVAPAMWLPGGPYPGCARVGRAALPACLKLFRRGVFGSGWWIPLGFVCSAARGVFAFGGGKVWWFHSVWADSGASISCTWREGWAGRVPVFWLLGLALLSWTRVDGDAGRKI